MLDILSGGILGSIFGGVFRLAPEVLKWMDKKNEREHELNKLLQLGATLNSKGVKKVIFMGPAPMFRGALPEILVKSYPLTLETIQRTSKVFPERMALNKILEEGLNAAGFSYANLIDLLCNSNGCLVKLGDDVKTSITTWDSGHFTPITSDFVAKNLLIPIILN